LRPPEVSRDVRVAPSLVDLGVPKRTEGVGVPLTSCSPVSDSRDEGEKFSDPLDHFL
jgi:hypothetical protein